MSTTVRHLQTGSSSAAYGEHIAPYAGGLGAPRPRGIDLGAIEARADRLGPYMYHDAREDICQLLKEVRRLQDQEAAVARLLCLAIRCGLPGKALLFLEDALGELGGQGSPPSRRPEAEHTVPTPT